MTLVTPLATRTFPSGSSTSVGYQRGWCMSAATLNEFEAGSKMRVVFSPPASATPTSAGSPRCRAMRSGSLYQSVPPAMRTRPSAIPARSEQNRSMSFQS